MQVFSRLNGEGRTVVLITHEADIAAYTKRVVHLRDGHIVSDDRQTPIDAPPPLPPATTEPLAAPSWRSG